MEHKIIMDTNAGPSVKHHLSEIVFSALVGFSLTTEIWFLGSTHTSGLVTSGYCIHEVGVTVCGVQHVL